MCSKISLKITKTKIKELSVLYSISCCKELSCKVCGEKLYIYIYQLLSSLFSGKKNLMNILLTCSCDILLK